MALRDFMATLSRIGSNIGSGVATGIERADDAVATLGQWKLDQEFYNKHGFSRQSYEDKLRAEELRKRIMFERDIRNKDADFVNKQLDARNKADEYLKETQGFRNDAMEALAQTEDPNIPGSGVLPAELTERLPDLKRHTAIPAYFPTESRAREMNVVPGIDPNFGAALEGATLDSPFNPRSFLREKEKMSALRNRIGGEWQQEDERATDEAKRQVGMVSADVDDSSSPVTDARAGRRQEKDSDVREAERGGSISPGMEIKDYNTAAMPHARNEYRIGREKSSAEVRKALADANIAETNARFAPEEKRVGLAQDKLNLEQDRMTVPGQQIQHQDDLASLNSPKQRAKVSGGAGSGFLNQVEASIERFEATNKQLVKNAMESSTDYDDAGNPIVDPVQIQGVMASQHQVLLDDVVSNFNRSFPGLLDRLGGESMDDIRNRVRSSQAPPRQVEASDEEIEALLLLAKVLSDDLGLGRESFPPEVGSAIDSILGGR